MSKPALEIAKTYDPDITGSPEWERFYTDPRGAALDMLADFARTHNLSPEVVAQEVANEDGADIAPMGKRYLKEVGRRDRGLPPSLHGEKQRGPVAPSPYPKWS